MENVRTEALSEAQRDMTRRLQNQKSSPGENQHKYGTLNHISDLALPSYISICLVPGRRMNVDLKFP